MTDLFGQVEHDGDRQKVVLPRQFDPLRPGLLLDVGGVHDRQPPGFQTLGDDVAQQFEGFFRDILVVFVIADHAPAEIGRNDFRRQKVFSRKRTFARPAGADEHDE